MHACIFALSTERQPDPPALWGVRPRLGSGASFPARFQITATL